MSLFNLISTILLIFFVNKSLSFDLYSELQNAIDRTEDVNSTCVDDIKSVFNAVFNSSIEDRQWALKMIDSSAKVPNGLLEGSTIHIGLFDECLKVVHPDGLFTGQHCMANVILTVGSKEHENLKLMKAAISAEFLGKDLKNLVLALKYGICVPSTCSIDELNNILLSITMADAISVSLSNNSCWTSEPISLSDGSWGLISFFFILIALAFSSTLYELYQIHVNKSDTSNILCSFSLYSNSVSLFEVRESSGEMGCLHGLRTLSMMWVLLCHTFASSLSLPIINFSESLAVLNDANYVLITNGYFSVDSFFFLSGLLVAFVFFRNMGKNGFYDVPSNYIHRYLRLTPSLVIIVLFNMTILSELSKAPLWGGSVMPISADCRETWWSTILYVQNYVQPMAGAIMFQCVGQTWYLSCDMQMFWIAPLVLYPVYLWPKIGMAFLGLLTIASSMLTFGLAYSHEYKASVIKVTDSNQYADDYVVAHTRIAPWFVGVCLGVAICALKARKITVRMSKAVVITGWLFSTGLCLGILYGITRFQRADEPSVGESAGYLAFTRLGWGVGLAWVVFACVYGYGGWINNILSSGIFQPLGKLSYNVYLVHMTVLIYYNGVYRTYYYFSNLAMLYNFFGALILSYLFAIVLYLLVDAPVAILDRKLLSGIKILPYPLPKKQENVRAT